MVAMKWGVGCRGAQSCEELRSEAVDYLEQDPRSEARLSQPQPPTVLAVDVTSDAADLQLLKASLTQARHRLCAASNDTALPPGHATVDKHRGAEGVGQNALILHQQNAHVLRTCSSSQLLDRNFTLGVARQQRSHKGIAAASQYALSGLPRDFINTTCGPGIKEPRPKDALHAGDPGAACAHNAGAADNQRVGVGVSPQRPRHGRCRQPGHKWRPTYSDSRLLSR